MENISNQSKKEEKKIIPELKREARLIDLIKRICLDNPPQYKN